MTCLRVQDWIVLGFFSFKKGMAIRQKFADDIWSQKEYRSFMYGMNIAFFSTLMTMVAIFGWQAPLIIVPVIFYIIFNNLGDAADVICFYKKETESFGLMVSNGVCKLMIGVLLAHFIILMISWFHKSWWAFSVNIFSFAVMIIWALLVLRKMKQVESIHSYISVEDKAVAFTEEQKKRWLELFCHPLIRSREHIVRLIQEQGKYDTYMARLEPITKDIRPDEEIADKRPADYVSEESPEDDDVPAPEPVVVTQNQNAGDEKKPEVQDPGKVDEPNQPGNDKSE